jgi:hypothetical protein
MKKQNKFYASLLLSLIISTQLLAQTETFDIATYTPPKGWEKVAKAEAINYKKIDDNSFCVITIFESTVSNNDATKNFATAWKQLVATP